MASHQSPALRKSSEPEIIRAITGVKRRDTIIAKLAAAMNTVVMDAPDLGLSEDIVEQKAIEIESMLDSTLGRDPHAHKTKFLQLLRNLRDENNAQLRVRVAVGHISPEDLINLSATEMASEEAREKIREIEDYNKEASKARKANGEVTERFGACAKCKSPKTSYFMMQTRSADEPMTIFISCIVCGHSWRK